MNQIGEKEILSFSAVFFGTVLFVFGQWTSSMVHVTSLSNVNNWKDLKIPKQIYAKQYIWDEDTKLIEKLTRTTGFGIFTGNKTVVDSLTLPILNKWRNLSPNNEEKKNSVDEFFVNLDIVSTSAAFSYIVNALSVVACLVVLLNNCLGGNRRVALLAVSATVAAGLSNLGLIVLIKCWPTSLLHALHEDIHTGSGNYMSGYQNGMSFYLIIISFLCFCTSSYLLISARKKYCSAFNHKIVHV